MGDDPPPRGMHGWDPGHSDMHGIFLASGPELARGIRIDAIEAVHVYPLLARLLHLTPNPDIERRPGGAGAAADRVTRRCHHVCSRSSTNRDRWCFPACTIRCRGRSPSRPVSRWRSCPATPSRPRSSANRDLGLLTQTEVIERARRICKAVTIPIIVDADTGYGSALNVMRTVNELIDAGAAGCFLEDQEWPKRCGHMPDKRVIGREEYLQKIGAAVDTRGDRDFFIVARTDALAPAGLDEALARVDAARAAGADATFVEAPRTLAELEAIGRRAPAPTVANMIEHGRTPVLDQTPARGTRLQPHPVPARRSVRIGARADRDLPASARGGDQHRRGRHADDVRPVQRLDRRGPAARAGGPVVRLIMNMTPDGSRTGQASVASSQISARSRSTSGTFQPLLASAITWCSISESWPSTAKRCSTDAMISAGSIHCDGRTSLPMSAQS